MSQRIRAAGFPPLSTKWTCLHQNRQVRDVSLQVPEVLTAGDWSPWEVQAVPAQLKRMPRKLGLI